MYFLLLNCFLLACYLSRFHWTLLAVDFPFSAHESHTGCWSWHTIKPRDLPCDCVVVVFRRDRCTKNEVEPQWMGHGLGNSIPLNLLWVFIVNLELRTSPISGYPTIEDLESNRAQALAKVTRVTEVSCVFHHLGGKLGHVLTVMEQGWACRLRESLSSLCLHHFC